MFTTHTPRDPRLTPATSQLDRRQSHHLKENHSTPSLCGGKEGYGFTKGGLSQTPSFPMQSLVSRTTTFSSADAINNPDLGWL